MEGSFLVYKRLEAGCFRVPKSEADRITFTPAEMPNVWSPKKPPHPPTPTTTEHLDALDQATFVDNASGSGGAWCPAKLTGSGYVTEMPDRLTTSLASRGPGGGIDAHGKGAAPRDELRVMV